MEKTGLVAAAIEGEEDLMLALDALEDYDACDVCRQHEHGYSVIPDQKMLDAWVKATEGFHPTTKQAAA